MMTVRELRHLLFDMDQDAIVLLSKDSQECTVEPEDVIDTVSTETIETTDGTEVTGPVCYINWF